ncbi:MAG: GNAT family N-acetyltransferase [Verrucomicrobia bacterium]|nr:GNAT family N-acetyltransferase [Verrucomicrobiota bacterium]MBI3871120.1 GNAT family N-acetyltransferase [Verrucomicrobiota bacterium]
MKADERVETTRLVLRRPQATDAEAIFDRYASDQNVTRFLGWPRHRSLEATREFLGFSDAEWARWPAGPYLLESLEDGRLLGSAGFAFETPYRAMTGYVIAKDAWGMGYATEALRAVVGIAWGIGLVRLYAPCHVENAASVRVLEKCGFAREGVLRKHSEFPNLKPGEPSDVLCYALVNDRARLRGSAPSSEAKRGDSPPSKG